MRTADENLINNKWKSKWKSKTQIMMRMLELCTDRLKTKENNSSNRSALVGAYKTTSRNHLHLQ